MSTQRAFTDMQQVSWRYVCVSCTFGMSGRTDKYDKLILHVIVANLYMNGFSAYNENNERAVEVAHYLIQVKLPYFGSTAIGLGALTDNLMRGNTNVSLGLLFQVRTRSLMSKSEMFFV